MVETPGFIYSIRIFVLWYLVLLFNFSYSASQQMKYPLNMKFKHKSNTQETKIITSIVLYISLSTEAFTFRTFIGLFIKAILWNDRWRVINNPCVREAKYRFRHGGIEAELFLPNLSILKQKVSNCISQMSQAEWWNIFDVQNRHCLGTVFIKHLRHQSYESHRKLN